MIEALGNSRVNAILTSQGSSEHSISVAVDEKDVERGEQVVRSAFELDMLRNKAFSVSVVPELSIVAVVGDEIRHRTGVAGIFFKSLGLAKVNVLSIASPERNISAVIPRKDLSRALRAIHAGFVLEDLNVSVGLIGCGNVGAEVVRMLAQFQLEDLPSPDAPAASEVRSTNFVLRGVCNVENMALADQGLPLEQLREPSSPALEALKEGS